jgi:hypothetical protein
VSCRLHRRLPCVWVCCRSGDEGVRLAL